MCAAPWFFAAPGPWGREVVLDGEESHHALRVLRLGRGDALTLTDGRGTVAAASVLRVDDERVVAQVERTETRAPACPSVAVFQGAAKQGKLDGAVERLAELGVSDLWVYESERTVVRWDGPKLQRHEQRWRSLARSAAKQSRNPFEMAVGGGLSFDELVERIAGEEDVAVLWERATLPLRAVLPDGARKVCLVVGPEGGLTDGEAAALAAAGGRPVSLGPVVLRTENAGMVAAAGVLYHYGLIG